MVKVRLFANWPNRDPLEESGFMRSGGDVNTAASISRAIQRGRRTDKNINLLSFSGNDAVGRYDLLGLAINVVDIATSAACPCECGPDVTKGVKSTLDQITSAFYAAGIAKQVGACAQLFAPTVAFDSWDMGTVLSSPNRYRQGSPCSGCDGTVTYNGSCHTGSDVNYIMFGHAVSLCGSAFYDHNQLMMDAWVTGGKATRNFPLGLPLGCASEMAGAGYTGGSSSCAGMTACKPSSKVGNSQINFRWNGLNN